MSFFCSSGLDRSEYSFSAIDATLVNALSLILPLHSSSLDTEDDLVEWELTIDPCEWEPNVLEGVEEPTAPNPTGK